MISDANLPFTVYKMNLDPDFMIKFIENLRPEEYDAFEAVAKRMILPFPNTYTYSKALSEQIVRKYGSNLNIAVVRPAIITTSYADPIPGYTDNVYGVNGVVTGAGVGILRILHINNDLKANIVPADFVVNAIIALSWFTALKK
jgi:alcohol-forming fatty acyl-CoA reductase